MSRKKSGEYPFDDLLDVDAFEYAADQLKLCRQQRRVTYGRLVGLTLEEIADHLGIKPTTARSYDVSVRERTRSENRGVLTRKMFAKMREYQLAWQRVHTKRTGTPRTGTKRTRTKRPRTK